MLFEILLLEKTKTLIPSVLIGKMNVHFSVPQFHKAELLGNRCILEFRIFHHLQSDIIPILDICFAVLFI